MASGENVRISKIEELILKHDERMNALNQRIGQMKESNRISQSRLRNSAYVGRTVEGLLLLASERIERLDRIDARLDELFGVISGQLNKNSMVSGKVQT